MTIAASASAEKVSPRNGYAQWAASYDKDANPVLALQERILRAILPDARSKTVVDLGCGTGHTLSLWRERNPARLIGLDLSLEMMSSAKSATHSLIAADCCALPFADGTADLVSCCLALGYLGDLESFASEAARIVSPGGAIIISELHPETVTRFDWRRGFGSGNRSVHIEARAIPINEVVSSFAVHGFAADILLEVPFGSPELPLFKSSGRREYFERFREHPAIYFLCLRRKESIEECGERFSLAGARVALSATEAAGAVVSVAEERIHSVSTRSARAGTVVDLSGYLLLPGLINAHDHLEFALFPRLGHGQYQNSRQWAEDIYRPHDSPIKEHLLVPKWVRLCWGGIRSLLCGVTTVCHHNPYDEAVFGDGFPIRVLRDFVWAHSLALDPELTARYAQRDSQAPFIIHAGEGIDRASSDEIRTLLNLRVLDSRTVIVHGTGLDDEGLKLLKESGAALVWCPSSNVFLFNKTLEPDRIASVQSKALGSDSPLTAAGDLLDELRFAHSLGAPADLLTQLVTTEAARVLRLKCGEGQIYPGAMADLVAVHDCGLSPADTLNSITYRDVELVILGGRIHLVSDRLKSSLPLEMTTSLEPLNVDGVQRWVRAPIGKMLQLSREALGPEITMCRRSLTQ